MSAASILVFGKSGQLARELARIGEQQGRPILCVGRAGCDLADGEDPMLPINAVAPAVVINAAAYTAVDKAESEPDAAIVLNRDAPAAIGKACAERGLPLIHISTDYVFDGTAAPYREQAPRAPLGVYGASKAAGEDAVLKSNARAAVVRTAWLWSVFGANFPKTMLRLAGHREEIAIVADQIGRPTSAAVAACALVELADRLAAGEENALGLFHLSNRGEATWADFAEAIFSASGARGGPSAKVKRITTADYPTPARRPADSRLDASKLEALLGAPFPHWRDSLEAAMDELVLTRETPSA